MFDIKNTSIRLDSAKDMFLEGKRKIMEQNKKIVKFRETWNENLENLEKTSMRSIMQAYDQLISDSRKIYKSLLNHKLKSESNNILVNSQTDL